MPDSVLMSRSKPLDQVIEVPADVVAGHEAMGWKVVPDSQRDDAAKKITYPSSVSPGADLVVMTNKKLPDQPIAVPADSVEGYTGLGWTVAPKKQQADPVAVAVETAPTPAPEG